MSSIFISYSSSDKSLVKKLAGLLEHKGWSVWWDRDIPIGQSFDTVIENELQAAKCVIVVWTQRSIASRYVKDEAMEAKDKGKLVPIVLEQVDLPLAFKHIESAMLIDWDGEEDHPELEMLFHSIENILENKSGSLSSTDFKATDTYLLRKKRNAQLKIAGLVLGVILLVVAGLQIIQKPVEGIVTIRVYDWKKNPVTQGYVKIYLLEYIREQSIDKMGQALFTGIPAQMLNNKMRIEVSSSGFMSRTLDTLITNSKPLELSLKYSTLIIISGKVKTAAEIPINGVEVNVDGTRYYGISITDGSYKIPLEKYTIGDEIKISTFHQDFEDKKFSLKLVSPEMKDQDIYLNPNTH